MVNTIHEDTSNNEWLESVSSRRLDVYGNLNCFLTFSNSESFLLDPTQDVSVCVTATFLVATFSSRLHSLFEARLFVLVFTITAFRFFCNYIIFHYILYFLLI